MLIPLLDHRAVIDVNRTIPQWREVFPGELKAMVECLVKRYPEVPSHFTL